MTDEQETKQDLIKTAKALGPTEGPFSLVPRTFEEAFRFANFLAESTIIPKEFQRNPANVLIAIQFSIELGVSPMQGLQSIYVINGKPSIYGDLPLAIVYQSGQMEVIEEQGDEKSATCMVKRKGYPAITRTFTMQDAIKAKLVERNPTYQTYPKRMLQLRARALALRDAFADVLKGIAIAEEHEENEARDVTPRPQLREPEAIKDAIPPTHTDADRKDERTDSASPSEDRRPSRKRTSPEKSEAGAEGPTQSTDDPEAAELKWIETAPEAEFMDKRQERIRAVMRLNLSQQAITKICQASNNRKDKILAEIKPDA